VSWATDIGGSEPSCGQRSVQTSLCRPNSLRVKSSRLALRPFCGIRTRSSASTSANELAIEPLPLGGVGAVEGRGDDDPFVFVGPRSVTRYLVRGGC